MAGGLSNDEIEKMRKEAELNAAADTARQETFRARESARASVAKIEEVLPIYFDRSIASNALSS